MDCPFLPEIEFQLKLKVLLLKVIDKNNVIKINNALNF